MKRTSKSMSIALVTVLWVAAGTQCINSFIAPVYAGPIVRPATPSRGASPLTDAILMRKVDLAKRIIRDGADPNDGGPDGTPPLCWAASRPDLLEIVVLLLEKKADVNGRGSNGFSPLHYACESGSVEEVAYLVAHGADVKLADVTGVTPLHVLVWTKHNLNLKGRLALVQLLIGKDAPLNATDDRGETPLDLALEAGHDHVARDLVAAGAKRGSEIERSGLTTARSTTAPANATTRPTKRN